MAKPPVSPADVLGEALRLVYETYGKLGGDDSALQRRISKLDKNVATALEELARPVDIAVHLEDGMIHDIVRADDRPVRVFVHDHDTDDAERSALDPVHWNDGRNERAIHSLYNPPEVSDPKRRYLKSLKRAHNVQ